MQDFDEFIVNLVRSDEPDLDRRLETQAEAVSALECTNPILGKWIDTYDVEYLLAAFNLNDDDFAENFPEMTHLNRQDRSQIIEAFEDHFVHCSRCHLKRGYDLEMNARIEMAYRQHGDLIARKLNETRDEHRLNTKCQEELSQKDLDALADEVTRLKVLGVAAAQVRSTQFKVRQWAQHRFK